MTSWLVPAVALLLHIVGVLCLVAGLDRADRAAGVRGAVAGLAGTGLLVLQLVDQRRTGTRAGVRITARGIVVVGAVLAAFYLSAGIAGPAVADRTWAAAPGSVSDWRVFSRP